MFLVPLNLQGEGEYNLNSVTEIKVTESYLGMDQTIIGCQNKENIMDCTTRQHIKKLLDNCKCLPFTIPLKERTAYTKESVKDVILVFTSFHNIVISMYVIIGC